MLDGHEGGDGNGCHDHDVGSWCGHRDGRPRSATIGEYPKQHAPDLVATLRPQPKWPEASINPRMQVDRQSDGGQARTYTYEGTRRSADTAHHVPPSSRNCWNPYPPPHSRHMGATSAVPITPSPLQQHAAFQMERQSRGPQRLPPGTPPPAHLQQHAGFQRERQSKDKRLLPARPPPAHLVEDKLDVARRTPESE
jgi:hypothetical protein